MANEPERPIEKLLRAAANKRRDDAGAPFDLHPATRRLLQGEVARKFAKAQHETRSFAKVLGQLWPRFAWGFAIFAVLGAAVWVLLPVPGGSRPEALLAKKESMLQTRQAKAPLSPPLAAVPAVPASPAPAAEAKPASVATADKAQAAPRSPARRLGAERKEFAADSLAVPLGSTAGEKRALAATAQLAARQDAPEMHTAVSGGLAAQAPAGTVNGTLERRYGLASKPASSASLPGVPASPPAVALTPEEASRVAADESAKLTSGRSDQAALQFESRAAVASANRPQSASLATDSLSKAAAGARNEARGLTVAQRFVQVASEAKAKGSLADKATPAHPVLASFQIEQAGQDLWIVDDDGSVYRGYVQLADATRRARPVKAEEPAAIRAARAPAGVLEERAVASLHSDQPTPHAYYFRVAGTNRSLNKKVVFTGNLLAATNLNLSLPVATNLGMGGGRGGFQDAPTQQRYLPLLNSRISGKAVIGSGQAVEINALPTSP